ncbi:MAG: BON domain-containing protein [Paraburkholderia sp.]|uniref:BON domain-containing protein n=1 Tax=Paraburkholderia sp. TaxID=1926495 RepID=UPI003C4861F1
MKTTTMAIVLAVGTLVLTGNAEVHAQSSNAASAPVASGATDPKAIKAANRALQKDVLRALTKTKGLRNSTITVRANNGAVTLEGTVPEESQVDMATHAAEGVAGVTSVKNALTLSSF